MQYEELTRFDSLLNAIKWLILDIDNGSYFYTSNKIITKNHVLNITVI